MKKLLLSLGVVSSIVVPSIAVVACSKNKKEISDNKDINLSFTGKVDSLKSLSTWKADFYDGKLSSDSAKKFTLNIDLPKGANYSVALTPTQLIQVQGANGTAINASSDMSLDDFVSLMSQVTGSTHQFHFAKVDGKKLGVDGLLARPDASFQKQWLMDNLIKELPNGITIENIKGNHLTNNLEVTFKKDSATKKVTFNLAEEKTQDIADAKNAKGGSAFYKAIKAIETPIKKLFGEIKEIGKIAKSELSVEKVKNLLTGMATAIADDAADEFGKAIPIYGEITSIPIFGSKISAFVDDHLINPIVQKIADHL